jgi:hypothetical protein
MAVRKSWRATLLALRSSSAPLMCFALAAGEAQYQPEKGVVMTTTSRRRVRKAPLLFAAVISALLLTAGLGAARAPALAAPVHQAVKGQVSPDFSCESGYGGWYVDTSGGPYWLWIGTDESAYVVTDTTQGSCWRAPDSNDTGEIKNEAGDCLQWNSKTGYNFMNTCNDGTPQRWETLPTGQGSDYFENIWALDNGKSAIYLHQLRAVEDSTTNLGSPADVGAAGAWIHADCSSSC